MQARLQRGQHTVLVREAIHGDVGAFRDVIRAIFGDGGDYVYDQYHELLHTLPTNSFCAVAEVDGKLVAFLFLTPLGDNESVYVGGERVHPAFQKLGIVKMLTRYAFQEYSRRVRAERIVSHASAGAVKIQPMKLVKTIAAVINADKFRQASTSGFSQLLERNLQVESNDVMMLPSHSWQDMVSADDICSLFPTMYRLFFDRCLALHCATPATVRHRIRASDLVLISIDRKSSNRDENNGNPLLTPTTISFSEVYISTGSDMAYLSFTMYGKPSDTDVLRHLERSMTHLRSRLSPTFRGQVRLQVFCPDKVNLQSVKCHFQQIGGTIILEHFQQLGVYVEEVTKSKL